MAIEKTRNIGVGHMMKQSCLFEILKSEAIHVSAQDVADMVGTNKSQVLYWGRTGFLNRRKTGHKIYPISELRKAILLSFLINKIGLDGKKASQLADGLLQRIESDADAIDAIFVFLQALHKNLDGLIELITSSEFDQHLLRVPILGAE